MFHHITSQLLFHGLAWLNHDDLYENRENTVSGLNIVHNDFTSSYNDLLQKSQKDFMYVFRVKNIACFVFIAMNNNCPDLTNNMFNEKQLSY